MVKFIIGNEYVLQLSCQKYILHCVKRTPKMVLFVVDNPEGVPKLEYQRLKIFYDEDNSEYVKWDNVILHA